MPSPVASNAQHCAQRSLNRLERAGCTGASVITGQTTRLVEQIVIDRFWHRRFEQPFESVLLRRLGDALRIDAQIRTSTVGLASGIKAYGTLRRANDSHQPPLIGGRPATRAGSDRYVTASLRHGFKPMLPSSGLTPPTRFALPMQPVRPSRRIRHPSAMPSYPRLALGPFATRTECLYASP